MYGYIYILYAIHDLFKKYMKDAIEYLDSWERFRAACDRKAKDRCVINSDGWRKLREFHLEQYLNNLENPLMFLLNMKWKSRKTFDSHRMAKYYYRYLRNRAQIMDNPIPGDLVAFASWRK